MLRRYQEKTRLTGRSAVIASVLAGALYVAAPAKAALLIGISDPTDGGSASATKGVPSALPSTSFSLPAGAFGPVGNPDVTYSAIQGSSDSPGTPAGAEITLDSVKLTNLSGVLQTIVITVADTDYAAPGGPGTTLNLYGSFAGTADSDIHGGFTSQGNASMSSYADPLDGPNASVSPVATTTVTSTPGPTPFATIPGPFIGATPIAAFTRSNVGPGLYSLAGVTTVTLLPGSVLNLDNNTVTFAAAPVPEPASLTIFAAAGSLLLKRRRRASTR
jgi:hypothetical protein